MKAPQAPRIDQRRKAQFSAELEERARTWIPGWAFADVEGDFGHALLDIAARFDSEVTERLDGAGEKMRRGFLDWLAVRGEAARPARMPVVFKLADGAKQAVLASAPVRMQADAGGTPVIFETEKDVRVVPGRLDVVVGVDADQDAFYLPPPGLSDLKPLEQLPTQWQLKSFAAAGANKLQLDPEAGLVVDMIIEAGGKQYRITNVDNGIVTVEPRLDLEIPANTVVRKVVTFAPFDCITRNRQEHALYLGHMDLLNIEAKATIDVIGASALQTGIKWQYWGKTEKSEEPDWQTLKFSKTQKSDALILEKDKGSVEPKKIGDINSRWIRAYTTKVEGSDPLLQIDALKIRINCVPNPPCPPQDSADSGPTAEAMANNTPLVLSEPFYPLGREPRQFDAFYLGSAEAFSKKGAVAQVCFEMSDATCTAFVPVRAGVFSNQGVLAAVGKDRALHLFKLAGGTMTSFRGPLRPPTPPEPNTQPKQTTPVELNSLCRPVIWNAGDDFFVAVAGGGSIWIWHENATDQKQSGWSLHSTVPDLPGRPADIQDIVVLSSAPNRPGAVLSNGRFWVFDGTNWTQPKTPPLPGTPLRDFASIAPIYDAALNPLDSVIAVGVDQFLYRLERDGSEVAIATPKLDVGTAATAGAIPVGGIRPAAIDDVQLRVVAVNETRKKLLAVKQGSVPQEATLSGNATAIGAVVTLVKVGSDFEFYLSARRASDDLFVASWIPTFVNGDPATIFESRIPGATEQVGTPQIVGTYIAVPGSRGDAFVAPYNPAGRLSFTTKAVGEAVVLQASAASVAPFAVGEFLSALTDAGARAGWTITKTPRDHGPTEFLYIVEAGFGASVAADPKVIGYTGAGSPATVQSNTRFDIPAADPGLRADDVIRVLVGSQVGFFEIDHVDVPNNQVFIKAGPPLPGNAGDGLTYWKPNTATATVLPAIEFDPLIDVDVTVTLLDTAKFYFDPQFQPSTQTGTSYGVVGTHPTVVALAQRWVPASAPPLNVATPFVIGGVIGAWQHQLADTASNPALSWEYWNGKGWWSLEIIEDGTERLANTGPVKFNVPQDIAASDWAGKTNFWIRARLVGGDYGEAEVKVISKPGPNPGETEQIVERTTENIKAPQVLDLQISYSICDPPILPTYVLAQDSGSILNQSDANSTGGAIVEAFVPLSLMLGRLSASVTSPPQASECPPRCECQKHNSTNANAPTASTPAGPVTPETGRSLFVGLDATVSEAPVNVLLLVNEEHDHTAFAPITTEALIAGHFKPIVAADATRALGESGVLSMSFAVPPTLSDLFGRTRTWLRLIPKSGQGDWSPSLRGAYLNAVFASATETLTRELVGSADGSPNLTLRLARPPVLSNTLELRVREPLGEEERDELVKSDPNLVLTNPDGLAGDWVLWKQVIDPDDLGPAERVYALDEAIGEIRFGDGIHGRIPPIGRDAIVAFHYSRTEVGSGTSSTVPGNLITARTPLNLVSPVESVEAVFAADQSAGGAPPESDERVLRFGFARLRHRGRAVTANDIEDLALESSPDIAQARAVVKRGYIRLVVVMKGKKPIPNSAQVRELRRLLLDAAPVSLSAPNAWRIEGPGIRKLRIELVLEIETLEDAGKVSEWAKNQLAIFFDSTTGGIDKDGWPLGFSPTEEDIAFVLINAPHLDGIANVKLFESLGDGIELPWPSTITPTDIVMLDEDPVRIQFETAEVMA